LRAVFVPEHLSTLYLIDWSGVSEPIEHAVADEVMPKIEEGILSERPEAIQEALEWLDSQYEVLWQNGDRYAAALIQLCQSDLARRLGNWDRALEMSIAASTWVKLSFSQVASYNEAVSLYNQALVRAVVTPEKEYNPALDLLKQAHSRFEEARQVSGYGGERSRWEKCNYIIGWIDSLKGLLLQSTPDDALMLIPVYAEQAQGQVRLDRAVFVPERSGSLLSRVEDPEPRIIVLGEDMTRLPDWGPGDDYFGVRLSENGEMVSQSHKDDVLVLRRVTPLPLAQPEAPAAQAFIRLPGGRVAFLSTPPLKGRHFWLAGIPQALLRGLDHD